ncbi:MAG: DNA repair protein RecN [Deltaproteobacteria bacterium]|nr:DNA repair protein RecN [Deltaproteobacteria bacterium]
MLSELSIKNFAIIDDIKIKFADGLTILSGETGAGKSLLIEAVNLLLGARASSKIIRTGCDAAELEAFFDIKENSYAAEIMKKNDYDPAEGLMIRRIISANEKHKIYINDKRSSMSFLSAVTENLASISAQHSNQKLLKETNHLLILDKFAGLTRQVKEVKSIFKKLENKVLKLNELTTLKNRNDENLDFLKFQLEEITGINPIPNEDSKLEQEIKILKNAENLYKILSESMETLYLSEGSAAERLAYAEKNIKTATEIDGSLADNAVRIADIKYKIEDIISELRNYTDKISIDEKRLEDAENRAYDLSKLKKKYGGTIEAVLKKKDNIKEELISDEDIAEKIKKTKKSIYEIHKGLSEAAMLLSAKREKAAITLSEAAEKELVFLKIGNCRFKTVLKPNLSNDNTESYFEINGKTITETGLETAYFNISANPGEPPKPLASIASGGELSRVILALKAILAKTEDVATIIFDEVDAGIGGKAAELAGKKLSDLSKFYRIICITHLPQIAKFGDHHFKIVKKIENRRTKIEIITLNKEARIKELAEMMGGEKITQATIDYAKEMLKENRPLLKMFNYKQGKK